MPEAHSDMTTPTYNLIRTAMWIVGGIVFGALLLWAASSGFTLSDTAWKSITSISLAIIAAAVPAIISKLNRVEKHTNSIVERLVQAGRDAGEETGRRKEVKRANREEEEEEEDKDTPSENTTTLKDLDGKEVTIEGTLTEKDEDDKKTKGSE